MYFTQLRLMSSQRLQHQTGMYQQKEEKTSDLATCALGSCCCLFTLGFIAAAISYIVFGIMFLVQDYDVAHQCQHSHLWAYVLVTLIIGICNGGSLKNSKDENNQANPCTIVCLLLFDMAMSIWGGIEIYSLACDDLKATQLYTFAQVVFYIYTVISGILLGIVLWLFVAMCCCTERLEVVETKSSSRNDHLASNELTFESVHEAKLDSKIDV